MAHGSIIFISEPGGFSNAGLHSLCTAAGLGRGGVSRAQAARDCLYNTMTKKQGVSPMLYCG